MNISSVSSSSNTYSSGSSSDVQQLQNKLKDLENQIKAENQSKDDDKTKQQKVQLLQVQIQQIQNQIKAKQSNQMNRSQQETQQETKPDNTTANKAIDSLSYNKINIQA